MRAPGRLLGSRPCSHPGGICSRTGEGRRNGARDVSLDHRHLDFHDAAGLRPSTRTPARIRLPCTARPAASACWIELREDWSLRYACSAAIAWSTSQACSHIIDQVLVDSLWPVPADASDEWSAGEQPRSRALPALVRRLTADHKKSDIYWSGVASICASIV